MQSPMRVTTTQEPRTNNHRYNHRHKLQPQFLDLPTNSKSKNFNQKKKLKIFNKTLT